MKENVGAGGTVLRRRVLELIMTDPILARHEDHRGRNSLCKIAGVVARSRDHPSMREAQRLCCGLDLVHDFRRENDGLLSPNLLERNLHAATLCNLRNGFSDFGIQSVQCFRLWIAEFECEGNFTRYDVPRRVGNRRLTNRGYCARPMIASDLLGGEDDLG